MISRRSKTSPQSCVQNAQHGALGPVTRTLVLLCAAWELQAQPTDLHFEHLTVEQGLSFNEVTAVLQDSRGFMWFATANGLNRYDGYTFTTYKPDLLDSASLSGPWINLLYEDRHGDLWITTGGLNRWDRVTAKISRYLSDRHLTSICEDSSSDAEQDGMWFTTSEQGVYRYQRKSKRWTDFRHNPHDPYSITSDSTYCASLDVTGRLWIGTARGLNSLDRSRPQFAHYPHGPKGGVYTVDKDQDEPSRFLWIGADDGLYVYDFLRDTISRYQNDLGDPPRPEDNDVRIVYQDSKGRLWVGMMGGIARFDRSTRRFTSYQADIGTSTWGYVNRAWSICEDRTGTMWMISPWGPLRKYDEVNNKWTQVPIPSDHEVAFHALCEDRSGTMWFGTVNDGLLKLDRARKPFSCLTKIPGDTSSLSSATVAGICEDASGVLWVGTRRGLNKLNASTGTFTHYRHDDRDRHSLSDDRIGPILEDRRGKLWIGTDGGGLDEFDRTSRRFVHHRYRSADSLSLISDGVGVLCEGRDGTLWIGTEDGSASEFTAASNIFRRHFPGYPRTHGLVAQVNAILEDHSGLIWIAAPPAGLNSFDRRLQKWTQFVRDPRAGNDPGTMVPAGTLSLCEDQQGRLWVGTDEGLFKFESRTGIFTRFSVKDGLADNFIGAIVEDGKDCLWLCTVNGLSKFDPASGSIRNYDAGDGVTIGPCRFHTGHRNRKGEIFFGGTNGFIRFHPDSIKDNPYLPPIVITAFKKFDILVPLDTAISEKKSVEMSYKENVFSFEFVALNFTSPQKNQYAYKLEGFDNDWVYSGTRRYATYTNLDGGSYIFRVKGSNNDGVWNEQGTWIVVVITPPLWATWWFRGFVFIAMLVLVGGGIRYVEIRKMRRRIELLERDRALERERSRISQDMHDEVGANLTRIAIISELAMKNAGDADGIRVQLQNISQTSREVVDSIGAIVWAINPRNDRLDNLAGYLREYASDYFEMTPMTCRFDFPDELPNPAISSVVRRNIFLAVKEAIHNIVKHAAATAVHIRLRFALGQLEIGIEDDGKGFLMEDISRFGNGLLNMRKRIESLHGTFDVQSRPGGGTKLRFIVPVTEGIPLS